MLASLEVIELLKKHKLDFAIGGQGSLCFFGYDGNTKSLLILLSKDDDSEKIIGFLSELGTFMSEDLKESIRKKRYFHITQPVDIEVYFKLPNVGTLKECLKQDGLIIDVNGLKLVNPNKTKLMFYLTNEQRKFVSFFEKKEMYDYNFDEAMQINKEYDIENNVLELWMQRMTIPLEQRLLGCFDFDFVV